MFSHQTSGELSGSKYFARCITYIVTEVSTVVRVGLTVILTVYLRNLPKVEQVDRR